MGVLGDLAEGLEDFSLVFAADTRAFICNLEHEQDTLGIFSVQPWFVRPKPTDLDRASRRAELDCVGQDVEQHLLDSVGVSDRISETQLLQVHFDRNLLRLSLCLHQVANFLDDFHDREAALAQVKRPVVEQADVEQVFKLHLKN